MNRIFIILSIILLAGCNNNHDTMQKIIFLHHSTGYALWLGKTNNYIYKITKKGDVQKYFENYNRTNNTNYKITEQFYPKQAPYGWNNYPYDYYNIWVKNAGKKTYLEEKTLEILTAEYDVIIFKHCFPVSKILSDSGNPDINSPVRSIENYKLQCEALKHKMHQFTDNKFIVWTPAVHTRAMLTEEEALRTREFYEWMTQVWDEKGDNIFIWDFYRLETEGGLYLDERNAVSPENSHPNSNFSVRVAPMFSQFVIDVIESKIK